jgi:glucosamine--fructose-6-phosphate aminotransferase (isomerizing)
MGTKSEATIAMNSNVTSDMKDIFRAECLEQPARLAEVFRAYSAGGEIRDEVNRLKKLVRADRPLVWLGMGASYCSAIAGATRFTLSGRPSFCVEASEWLHFAFSTWDSIAGPILLTTSGKSAELVELCRQRQKGPRILICNDPQSACWQAADIRLPILSGIEKGNATQSYSNSTAICSILASEFLGRPWQADVAPVLDAFAQSLAVAFSRAQEIEEFCRGSLSLEIMGRGAAVGGAIMGALCVREMTTWRANGFSAGAFRHGPSLDVDSTHAAMILALGGTAELGRRIATDCVARGGKAILVVDQDPVENSAKLLTVKIDPIPEGWEGLTSVLVPQALTQALIARLGSGYVRSSTTIE